MTELKQEEYVKPLEIFSFIKDHLKHEPVTNSAVFALLRILKQLNPGDTYYDNYMWHYKKRRNSFVDYYHLLWNMGASLPINRILEIGCRTGISACQLLASKISFEGVKLTLFDLFGDGFLSPNLVLRNLKAIGFPAEQVEIIKGDSLQTVPAYIETKPEPYDYVLVDGNHDWKYAQKDLENVLPLIKKGGILFFDDIAPDGCKLIDLWQAFKSNHPEFYCTENMDGKGIGVGVRK